MFKFNSSHLNNSVMLKILKASRIALKSKRTVLIKNRKGNFFLKVKMFSLNGIRQFLITDLSGNDISDSIVDKYYWASISLSDLILKRIA